MRRIIFIISFVFINSFQLMAQELSTINVQVKNLRSDEGQLMAGLYKSEEDFLSQVYRGEVVKIKDGIATISFLNIPQGTYAVSVFHDENSNNKLDTNFLGIPKEDYGASNNAKGFMGPPKWEDAVIRLTDKPLDIVIKI